MKLWKHPTAIFLMALVLLFSNAFAPLALAEDCFALDVDLLDMNSLNSNDYVANNLSSQAQGIRVQKQLSDSSELATRVRLTLVQVNTQTLLFDKDYGYQSGSFDSGVIYLPYAQSAVVPYLVTLYVENYVFAMPFMHLQPRLQFNGGCTYGPRLRDLNPGLTSDWQMGTMVDLTALRTQGSQTISLCASNAYFVGWATLLMQGDLLSVQLSFEPSANVELHHAPLYVITDCASFTSADPGAIAQPAYSAGDWVDVTGAASALIYLPMQLSFDPANLSMFSYDLGSGDLAHQQNLWLLNQSGAYTWEEPAQIPEADPGRVDDGSGWIDGTGGADGSGWIDGTGGTDGSGWIDGTGGTDGSGWIDGTGGADGSGWIDGTGGADGSGWIDGTGGTDGSGWIDGTGGTDGSGWIDGIGWVDDSAWINGTDGSGGIDDSGLGY